MTEQDHRFEQRLRGALQELADEVEPAPLLERLDASRTPRARQRRRLAVAAVAGLTAAATVALVIVVRQLDRPGVVEPVVTPPRIIRISQDADSRPGAVDLALQLTPEIDKSGASGVAVPYLWAGRGPARLLPPSATVRDPWVQHLSADGTRFVRQNASAEDPRIELVDLETGRTTDLGGLVGACPALSPDNARLVMYPLYTGAAELRIVDVRSGAVTTITPAPDTGDCGHNSFGWSPDSSRLLARAGDGSVVLDLDGRVLRRLAGVRPANGSMSWSPDGRTVLLYRHLTGDYALADLATEGPSSTIALPAPGELARAMGWAGRRIVWLVEDDNGTRLVSTATDGSDPRSWVELDVGQRQVVAVEWSRDLTGTAR